MIRVNVEDIIMLIAKYRAAQNLNVHEVELYEGGVKIDVPQQFKDDWKFTGLGFCGYIEHEFYKTGFVDDEGNPAPPLPVEGKDDRTGTEKTGG